MEITIKKYRYGQRRLTSFSFDFETQDIYIPNFEDLYQGHKDTVFERITAEPENLTASILHEYLHAWLYENLGKKTSLQLDNIDKVYDKDGEHYIISLVSSKDKPRVELWV